MCQSGVCSILGSKPCLLQGLLKQACLLAPVAGHPGLWVLTQATGLSALTVLTRRVSFCSAYTCWEGLQAMPACWCQAWQISLIAALSQAQEACS